MYLVKDHLQLGETTKIFNNVDEPTLCTMIKEIQQTIFTQKRIKEKMIIDDTQ